MHPDPHPDLDAAQYAYMALSGERITQVVIQRIDGALRGGAAIEQAVALVYEFFARPIDWEVERIFLAECVARLRRGVIAFTIVVECCPTK